MRKASGRKDRLRFGLPFCTLSLGSIEMPAGSLRRPRHALRRSWQRLSGLEQSLQAGQHERPAPGNSEEHRRVWLKLGVSHSQAHAIAVGVDIEGDAGDLIRVFGILRK